MEIPDNTDPNRLDRWATNLLRPLFRAVATPGLGNPHTPYEPELMAAGAKPTAIMATQDVTTQMQQAIDNGSVIKIGDYAHEQTHRIYCHPSEIDNAARAADILAEENGADVKILSPAKILSEDDTAFTRDFFQNAQSASENDNFSIAVGAKTTAMQALLSGSITTMRPVLYMPGQGGQTDPDLEEAVQSGALSAVDFKSNMLVSVFAQADKQEEGRELFTRYFDQDLDQDLDQNNQDHYETLDASAWHKRIGALLGFTENDQAWHSGEQYQNPVIHQLMTMTSDIRQWARKETMLMDADPNRTIGTIMTDSFKP